jgi:NADH-quinone oxidoreductase subunit N
VFNAALAANAHSTALVWLTVIGLVNSAVASYYYLRLIVVMYMREPVIAEAPAPASGAMRLALVLAAIATIYLGVMPGRVLNYSEAGAHDLFPTAAGSASFASPTTVTPAK